MHIEKREEYRRGAVEAEERDARELAKRRERAWQLARSATALLRDKYHATRVVVFGSLIKDEMFPPWSDIDIAAWGVAPHQTFKAIGDVLWVSKDIEMNLVDVNTCSSRLLEEIQREGVDL